MVTHFEIAGIEVVIVIIKYSHSLQFLLRQKILNGILKKSLWVLFVCMCAIIIIIINFPGGLSII